VTATLPHTTRSSGRIALIATIGANVAATWCDALSFRDLHQSTAPPAAAVLGAQARLAVMQIVSYMTVTLSI
jgi:hypothetical protein